MLINYIQAAMRQARYEILQDDGTYYGEIPGFDGVYANASTLEACREELAEVLEEWILFRVSRNLPLPLVEGIADLAGTYLFEKIGDAVAAEEPVWDGDKWRVTVTLPYLSKKLGKLTFAADGRLVPSESDTPAFLEERANAD